MNIKKLIQEHKIKRGVGRLRLLLIKILKKFKSQIDFSLFLCYNENVHIFSTKSYNKYKDGDSMKTKKISVSEKRQITIPKEFFDALNIGKEIECSIANNCIIIKPVVDTSLDEFSEYILKDILNDGIANENILNEFKKRKEKLKKAAKKYNADIDKEIENQDNLICAEDVFDKGDE